MRDLTINIITNNNQYGLSNDASILVNNLRQIQNGQKSFTFKVRPVNFYCSECGSADINFFLEIPNPLLIHSAKINILIPNLEWCFKTWVPYLHEFDEIWCKTKDSEEAFKKITATNIRYVGWTSIDRLSLKHKKNYQEYLHVAGKSMFKGTQSLIDSWKPEYPTLHLIYNKLNHEFIIPETTTNIKSYPERLEDDKLITLMNTCGIHLCPSEAEGYGHYLNEARSWHSIIVTTKAEPRNTLSRDPYLIKVKERQELGMTFGIRSLFDPEDFNNVIKKIMETPIENLKQDGELARQDYLKNAKTFRNALSSGMVNIISKLDKQDYQEKIPMEIKQNIDNLPSISIVTLTHNRPNFFNLALMNYKGTDYPEHLLEWIIIDDSDPDKCVKDLIPSDLKSVNYIQLDQKTSIGEKRNLAVKQCNHEIIMMMDDDDIYPPRHALVKISYLNHYKKQCGFCTSIGCFHIKKLISTINVPPIERPSEHRVSEATLCFYKSFWEERPFLDSDQGEEAGHFIKNRDDKCVIYPWRSMIVSLLHSKNISSRVKNIGDEPNGCHFGLSDELFSFITSLE